MGYLIRANRIYAPAEQRLRGLGRLLHGRRNGQEEVHRVADQLIRRGGRQVAGYREHGRNPSGKPDRRPWGQIAPVWLVVCRRSKQL